MSSRNRGTKPEQSGAEQSAPDVAPEPAKELAMPEQSGGAPAAPAPAVPKPARAGMVELVALKTCGAHGMPHYEGERFFATREVGERLVKLGSAKPI